MSYIEKRVTAGRIKDGMKYHTSRHNSPKRPRAKNTNKTTDRQAKINENNSWQRLYHLICANFKEDDFYITPTYKDMVPGPQEAKQIIKKYTDDLRKFFKKIKVPFKYIVVTEHIGKRIHHHMLISRQPGIRIAHFRQFWEHGFVHLKPYGGEPEDAERMTNYFIKETKNTFNTRDKVHGLRWASSKNLIQPKVEKRVIHASSWREEPKPPKGYYLAFVRSGHTEYGYPYQHYRMIKISEEEGGEDETHLYPR